MDGNEITNHLNAAIVACELAKSKLLPMCEERFPEKVDPITAAQWQTITWYAKEMMRKAIMNIEDADLRIEAIGNAGVTA